MSTASSDGPAPCLLLLDDDSSFLKALARAMSRLGFLVYPISCPEEALLAVEKLQPDYAAVDLHLADSSGIEVIAEITNRSPDTTTILLSGYADVRCAAAATRAGAADCLAKPVHAEQLQTALVTAGNKRAELPDRVMHPDEARMKHVLSRWVKNGLNTTRTAAELGMHRRSLQRLLLRNGFSASGKQSKNALRLQSRFPGLYRFWSQLRHDNETADATAK